MVQRPSRNLADQTVQIKNANQINVYRYQFGSILPSRTRQGVLLIPSYLSRYKQIIATFITYLSLIPEVGDLLLTPRGNNKVNVI